MEAFPLQRYLGDTQYTIGRLTTIFYFISGKQVTFLKNQKMLYLNIVNILRNVTGD